jgi:hypothetical protein
LKSQIYSHHWTQVKLVLAKNDIFNNVLFIELNEIYIN